MLPLIKREESSDISTTNAAIVPSSCSQRQILTIIFVGFVAGCGIAATTLLSPDSGTVVSTILSEAFSAAGGTVNAIHMRGIGNVSYSPSFDFTTQKPKSGPTAGSATTEKVATTDYPRKHPANNPTPFPTKHRTKAHGTFPVVVRTSFPTSSPTSRPTKSTRDHS